jgi:acetyl-CoA carboxylase biotin carboxyl carrier protein
MKIDPKTIKELAKLLEQTGLTEIEVAEGDKVIRVSKGATAVVSSGGAPAYTMSSDPTAAAGREYERAG